MTTHHVAVFDATLQKTHHWLDELVRLGSYDDEAQAYTALRAVLHALRDRLMPDEAVHLGAQLPMLIRGFYYEGWSPSRTPRLDLDDQARFIDHVEHELRSAANIDPHHAVASVFQLLSQHVTHGEIDDVRQQLPQELQRLWPQ
ncbi:MAG: DUF2267 domain-containing protein [Phycisphaeraceae bacterium]